MALRTLLFSETCRTPGFWGTHGGTEKKGSQNITGQVLNAAGGINVCGSLITTTTQALDSICVSPNGQQVLQLERQLVSAA